MESTYMKRRTACTLRPSSVWTTLLLAGPVSHITAAFGQNSADAAADALAVRFVGIRPGTPSLTLTG